jgi:hypothetical protein
MISIRKVIAAILIAAFALPSIIQPPLSNAQAPVTDAPQAGEGPLPLSAYPRPKNDNGMGIHWSSNPYGQDDKTTDYFVDEIKAMGIKWVKFLNDQADGRHYDYLVKQLVANDIMPVMRIYTPCNENIDSGALAKMVDHYLPMGVYYYELYNEPDIPGPDGGWCDDREPQPEKLAELWAGSAAVITAHGGYPSLPSIFPKGKGFDDWQDSFFQRFLRAIKAQGNTRLLYRSWGAVHNYAINHPPTYPMDDVNLTGRLLTTAEVKRYKLDKGHIVAINNARKNQKKDGGYYVGSTPTQDVTGFLQFIGYHGQFVELFGFEIPLISTEGGATIGSCEDPRYPCVDEQLQKQWTLKAYEYMLGDPASQWGAPDYYFANCTWLIAQKALDFYGGTVWESNAWYHDRKGNQIAVVKALKTSPLKGTARWNMRSPTERLATLPPAEALPAQAPAAVAASYSTPTANNLASYPRPKGDNGRGVHYAPTLFTQPPERVDFFIDELSALNIKWVKILQGDSDKIEHEYLIKQLVSHDMEPILRVYKPLNDPYENLTALVTGATALGVHYFELYNEPNIAGAPGGWREGEDISVERILDLWIPAAEEIQKAGGYPGLPSLAVGGDYEDMRFLKEFLLGLKSRRREDLLERAWIPLHNYFLNHPMDYPNDPVNLKSTPVTSAEIAEYSLQAADIEALNNARAHSHEPGGYYVGDNILADSNGFRKYEAYGQIYRDIFGATIPVISTEGGAIAGDHQDPRYPQVSPAKVSELTLAAYQKMLDAPSYYFAFTPWLLANGAGSHWDNAWEAAAWYQTDGSTLPVVDALKNDPHRLAVRSLSGTEAVSSLPAAAADSSSEAFGAPGDSGNPFTWEVAAAKWKSAGTPYPFLYVDVVDENGERLPGEQILVVTDNIPTLLLADTFGEHSAAMPLVSSSGEFLIGLAGEGNAGVQAKAGKNQDLYIVFRRKPAAKS